jgi:hypothetical protein
MNPLLGERFVPVGLREKRYRLGNPDVRTGLLQPVGQLQMAAGIAGGHDTRSGGFNVAGFP